MDSIIDDAIEDAEEEREDPETGGRGTPLVEDADIHSTGCRPP
jgi:hypothetical protein